MLSFVNLNGLQLKELQTLVKAASNCYLTRMNILLVFKQTVSLLLENLSVFQLHKMSQRTGGRMDVKDMCWRKSCISLAWDALGQARWLFPALTLAR